MTEELRRYSTEITFASVDPELMRILTGGGIDNPPPPTFAMTIHAPIRRTFWQWLRRRPRQYRSTYFPNVEMETPE